MAIVQRPYHKDLVQEKEMNLCSKRSTWQNDLCDCFQHRWLASSGELRNCFSCVFGSKLKILAVIFFIAVITIVLVRILFCLYIFQRSSAHQHSFSELSAYVTVEAKLLNTRTFSMSCGCGLVTVKRKASNMSLFGKSGSHRVVYGLLSDVSQGSYKIVVGDHDCSPVFGVFLAGWCV